MNLTKTLQKHIIPSKRKWICTCEIGRASRFYYVTIVQKKWWCSGGGGVRGGGLWKMSS